MTCVCFQVFRGNHDHKADGPLIAKHFIGPAADGAHAFDCGDAIVSYEHLKWKLKVCA